MNIVLELFVFVLKALNVLDAILQKFGIKLLRITKEKLLKGFPMEIYDEINQPDIKILFEVMMKGLEKDIEMHFAGRFFVMKWLKRELNQRLLLRKALEETPEILQVPVKKPLYIVGPPRTGTTFLHWFLSCDKQFRSPMLWELMEPCPPGNPKDFTKDPKYHRAVQSGKFRRAFLSKKAYAAHASEADKPEECVMLHVKSFYMLFWRFALDSMDEYSSVCDNLKSSETTKHIYRYYKKYLQVLAYNHYMKNKRYLLKAPHHLMHIEAILDVFPDANFIFTHRRLSQIIPSQCSLIMVVNEQFGGVINEKWKKRQLSYLRTVLVSGVKSIDRLSNSNSKNPMYSLPYPRLVSDPLGEMRKLYDYFGMTLTPETESAMVHYLNNDPKKTTYGEHKYTLEEFDISVDDIKEEFKEYIEIMSKTTKLEDII